MTKISTRLTGNKIVDRLAYKTVRFIVTTFCRTWCRMTVEGRENVPSTGTFLLAPTHRSILDTPIASGVTRRRMRFMGADKYWKNKAFGRLLTALGGFPVTRGTADREALKRCIAVLEQGEPLVLFPEGERKSGPLVQPLFDGATFIAVKAGVPIVPVGIGGSERAMPKGAKFISPRKVHVVIGKPLQTATVTGSPKAQRDAARRLTTELHSELQRLFDLAQARVG
ncbi:MAG: lysophospholipid acyltransferase family protein [Ilumatobacteraceae bacterium]